jgi:hypothetical protein
VWELFVLTLVLQIGMLPLLASAFHRVTFAGTFVNFAAVPLTAIIVPFGFFILGSGFLWPALGKLLAGTLSLLAEGLLHVIHRVACIALELPRTGSVSLDDDYFSDDVGERRHVFAPPVRGAQRGGGEFVGRIGCDRANHCYLSIFSASGGREAGTYGAGCWARRFLVRGFTDGQDLVD